MFTSTNLDNPVGVDISDISVKLVQLNKDGLALKLSAYNDVLLPPGLIKDDVVTDEKAFIQFLKTAFSNVNGVGSFHGKSVVASVPESKAFVRVITMPALAPDELATAVALEAEQYIPIPIDSVQLDWQIVGEAPTGYKVLITATPKDYVATMARILEQAGFIIQALEVESMAIARCVLPAKEPVPNTLILDMDANRTSLIVYADNSIQFTSSVPVAGNALTEAIAKALGVDIAEAERMKRVYGVPLQNSTPGGRVSSQTGQTLTAVYKALEPVLVNLFDEVKSTIKFHEEHSSDPAGARIERLMLCGGTSKLPNVADYLQGRLAAEPYFAGRKFQVLLADAWHNIIDIGQPPFSRREALSYTTAFGLALRNKL